MLLGDHARGIARQQRPKQSRRDARQEARHHRQDIAAGKCRDGIGDDKAGKGCQQQRPAAHTLRSGNQRNRGNQRPDSVEGDELPGQRIGNPQAGADLWQQARRQGFGQDRDEPRQRQGQQRCDWKTCSPLIRVTTESRCC